VVCDPGFDAAGLLALCRARLGVRAPRKVVVVATLPRNAAGKVLRHALPQLAGLTPR
jgi:acyl-coenzyme A synthetase/AMP-(fatty) acid ligase